MNDGEPSELGSTLPLRVQPASAPSSNKLLVVATLAALVLAGSAIVYRTRPYHYYYSSATKDSTVASTASTSAADKDSTPKTKQRKVLVNAAQEANGNADEAVQPESSHTPTRMDAEASAAKEIKSPRTKDRRKRGKDPLKEILKGKSKSGKALEFLFEHSHSLSSSPASSSTSLIPDVLSPISPTSSKSHSTNGTTGGGGSTSTKYTPTGTISGSTADSEQASTQLAEISQRQRQPDSPHSRQSVTPPHAPADDVDPYHQGREAAETNQIRTHRETVDGSFSPTPSSSVPPLPSSPNPYLSLAFQSAASRNSDGDGDVDHKYARTRSPNSDQALPRGVGGLEGESAGTTSQATKGDAQKDLEADSGAETETTAGMSLSSSLVLSEGGKHHREREADEEGTPATSPACSEKNVSVPRVEAQAAKKSGQRKAAQPGPLTSERNPSPKPGQSQTSDPWDWDGAGVGEASSSSVATTSSKDHSRAEKEGDMAKEAYQQPPRFLQRNGSAAAAAASFSSTVASGAGSAVPPSTSLNPPSNFHDAGTSINTSVSAPGVSRIGATTSVPWSPMSAVGDHGGQEPEREKEDEDEVFTFPTLNPTTSGAATAGAGPSRTRSSLGDTHTNNMNNINTTHGRASPSIGGRRRPPTPSRNNSHTAHSRNASNGSTPPPVRPMTPSSNSASGLGSPSIPSAVPALSTQTQLASLRGALEASRLREEKNKVELEKYAKEIETMRWENANWRRAEIELHAHIRNLMHQLQTYTAVFATNAHLQQYANVPNPPIGSSSAGSNIAVGTSTSAAPNGVVYPGSTGATSSSVPSTPGQPPTTTNNNTPNSLTSASQILQQQGTPTQLPTHQPIPLSPPLQPLHLQMLHVNGMTSPAGMLSPLLAGGPMSPTFPMGPYTSAPSSFFPYAMPPHLQALPHPLALSHAQQLHMQQQFQQHQQSMAQAQVQAQAQPSPHQASLFSMLFPTGSPASHHTQPAYGAQAQASGSTSNLFGNGPSSAAGTSSTGSLSPDLSGSPSPGPGTNGKRKSRTRTQTANGRMGGRSAWEDRGDGWVGGFGGADDLDANGEANGTQFEGDNQDSESECGFNELLADAILKRPGSIRVRSSSRRAKLDMEKEVRADCKEKDGTPPVDKSEKVVEEVELLTEFTFPSLSNLGNVSYRSNVKAVNGAYSSSPSSSSSLSPSVAVSDVAPEATLEPVAAADVEEERPRILPPLIEQLEDAESSLEVDTAEPPPAESESQEVATTPIPSPGSETTPRNEKLYPEIVEPAANSVDALVNGQHQDGTISTPVEVDGVSGLSNE